jgi:hypothetical protein
MIIVSVDHLVLPAVLIPLVLVQLAKILIHAGALAGESLNCRKVKPFKRFPFHFRGDLTPG